MKAIVLHEYGGPEKLKFEDFDDPVAGEGEVLVSVAAASINPIDWKMRSGEARARFPVQFPAILGRDFSGVVRSIGQGVTNLAPGDKVFGVAWKTYAQLCVVEAVEVAKVPEGLDLVKAAALPLVAITGEQLIRLGTKIAQGQTVLISGALGGVGRSAVRTAKDAGAKVIAGVRRKQLDEAKQLHADQTVALDDDDAMALVGFLDAVADTVGGATAQMLLGKVKPGGIFASVLGPPANAAMHPTVTVVPIRAEPDPAHMLKLAEDVVKGRLDIPIDRMIPLEDAAAGQEAAERGAKGKVLLLV
jgi:NADPH:quinone reductase-like Zn-dependent oxidoreductase